MDNVYDYMFHLLNEYSKLLKFKPTMPEKAVELYFRNDGPRHVFNVNDVIRTVRAMSRTQRPQRSFHSYYFSANKSNSCCSPSME